MKDYQNQMQQIAQRRKVQTRMISFVTALSLLLICTVPLFTTTPGVSMTNPNGTLANAVVDEYDASEIHMNDAIDNSFGGVPGNKVDGTDWSQGSYPLKTLLFGQGSGTTWVYDDYTLKEALAAAEDEYFLGFASDFCAFIKDDFTVYDADAEGRVAVGGDLTFDNNWNYQVGSGDFSKLLPITETESYSGKDNGRADFAHIICGGKLYHVNTVSTGNYEENPSRADERNWHKKFDAGNQTVVFNPEDDMYKKLLIGPNTLDGSLWYDQTSGKNVPYSSRVAVEMPGTNHECDHLYLNNINQLAQMYQYPYIRELINAVYNKVEQRSELLSLYHDIEGTIEGDQIIFDGQNTNAKTLYFTLNSWPPDARRVWFKNIPVGTNIVVNVGGEKFDIMQSSDGTLETKINDNLISNIHNGNRQESNDSNNNKESERILYNFYEATEGKLSGNINGTILAPKATVTAPKYPCPGHLSGALIAKSFDGGLEFGYRPYRGSADILGARTGYVVPVDKFVEDSTDRLADAKFVLEKLTEVDGATERVPVYRWASDDDAPSYVPIPLQVDYMETYTTAIETTTTTEPAAEAETETSTTTTTTVTTTAAEAADEDPEPQAAEPAETTTTTEAAEPPAVTTTTEPDTEDPEQTAATVTTEPQHIYPILTASYILREEQAPEQYFVSDKYYRIDVTEKINQFARDGRPNIVEYTVVMRSSDENEEIATINFTVYDSGDNTITRRITAGEDEFRITIDNPLTDPTVRSVEKKVGTEYQDITPSKKNMAQVIDGNFYYDPAALMIMPLLSFTPVFENRPSLLFEKVDDDGNPRTGAQIRLTRKGTNEAIPEDAKWDWTNEPSSCMIDVKNLPGGTYVLTEDEPPQGYEKAEPIEFTWDQVTQTLTCQGKTYPLPAKIRMTDNKIYGMKLKLYKYDGRTDDNESDALNGAVFKLYAEDGTLIKDGITTGADGKGKVDLNLSDVTNAKYVKNGYLLPGKYFLRETRLPTAAEGEPFTQPDDIYFEVKVKETTGGFEAVPIQNSGGVHALGFQQVSGQNADHMGDITHNGTVLNGDTTTASPMKGITSVKIVLRNVGTLQIYSDLFTHTEKDGEKIDGKTASDWCTTGDFTYNGRTYKDVKIYERTNLPAKDCYNMRIQNWGSGLDIIYAEFLSEDGTQYIYCPSGIETPETEETGLMTVDTQNPEQLKIANKSEPVNITAKKVWANDTGFEFLRKPIELELYRSTTELTAEQQAAYAESENGTVPGVTIETWNDNVNWNADANSTQTGTVTLNADNGWKYTWNKLQAFELINGTYHTLYYYVKEKHIPEVDYETTYVRDGNQLTVTNSMKNIELNAEKIWENQNQSDVPKPTSITVGLEVKHNGNWMKLPGKTLTLYSANGWKGEFTELPDGEEFRIYEISVPNGWKVKSTGTVNTEGLTDAELANQTLTITNVPDVAGLNWKRAGETTRAAWMR